MPVEFRLLSSMHPVVYDAAANISHRNIHLLLTIARMYSKIQNLRIASHDMWRIAQRLLCLFENV
jgi:hypothetical protein